MNGSGTNGGATTDASSRKSSDSVGSTTRKTNRRCMFGCTDGSSTLCRFPVHDPKRGNDCKKCESFCLMFYVLMGHLFAAVSCCFPGVFYVHLSSTLWLSSSRCQDWIDFFQVSENHIRESSLVNLRVCMKHFKEKVRMVNGKLIRNASVDSVSSTQSSKGTKRSRHSSIASSTHSDYTSDSEPRSKRSTDSTESAKKLSIGDINGGNRKLFVITPSDGNKTEGGVPGQKSKMFLILENGDDNDETKRHQKITLIADKSDAQTAERIEQLLPQLIQRIQSETGQRNQKMSIELVHSEDDEQQQETVVKERTNEMALKIQRVETLCSIPQPTEPKTTEVNLSSDLLFLMKMLPKLEAIEEPIKEHIKQKIENLLTQPLQEIAIDAYSPKVIGLQKIPRNVVQ